MQVSYLGLKWTVLVSNMAHGQQIFSLGRSPLKILRYTPGVCVWFIHVANNDSFVIQIKFQRGQGDIYDPFPFN